MCHLQSNLMLAARDNLNRQPYMPSLELSMCKRKTGKLSDSDI